MTALSEWQHAVRLLWTEAGQPTSRAIAEGVGKYSHGTVNDTVRGHRVPGAIVAQQIVDYLRPGAWEELRPTWSAARVEVEFMAPRSSDASLELIHDQLVAIRRLLEERLPVHEVACPECNCVIRARMADG